MVAGADVSAALSERHAGRVTHDRELDTLHHRWVPLWPTSTWPCASSGSAVRRWRPWWHAICWSRHAVRKPSSLFPTTLRMPTRWSSASSAGPDVGSRRGSRWPRRPAPRAQASAPWRGGCKAFWARHHCRISRTCAWSMPSISCAPETPASTKSPHRSGIRMGRPCEPCCAANWAGVSGSCDAADDQRRLVYVRLETAALADRAILPTAWGAATFSTESANSGHQGWLESGPKDCALSPIIAGQTVTTILPIC